MNKEETETSVGGRYGYIENQILIALSRIVERADYNAIVEYTETLTHIRNFKPDQIIHPVHVAGISEWFIGTSHRISFINSIAILFRTQIYGEEWGYVDLIHHLAQSYHHIVVNTSATALPANYKDSQEDITKEYIIELLSNNEWLVMIILINQMVTIDWISFTIQTGKQLQPQLTGQTG